MAKDIVKQEVSNARQALFDLKARIAKMPQEKIWSEIVDETINAEISNIETWLAKVDKYK